MKKLVKIKILDWNKEYTQDNFHHNFYVNLMSKKYDFIYSDEPDFVLFGPFGFEHLKYDCVRIFITHENVRTDWNLSDYGIDFDYMEFGDRHLRVPYFYYHLLGRDEEILKSREILEREKFCGIVISNGGYGVMDLVRNEFFDIISRYKKIDSGGRWNNNIGGAVKDKIEWLRGYKFNICFENSSYPGYLTEKLFDSYMAGCIPVYWGDSSICNGGGGVAYMPEHLMEYSINPKAFINAHDFDSFQDLVYEIIRVDNDRDLYLSMLQEPLWLKPFYPSKYYGERLFNFLDSIFSQEREQAYRRGRGQFLHVFESKMKYFSKYPSVFKYKKTSMQYALSVLQGISDISHFPRSIMRKLKNKS